MTARDLVDGERLGERRGRLLQPCGAVDAPAQRVLGAAAVGDVGDQHRDAR